MNSKERLQAIKAQLDLHGRVSVVELAVQLDVVQETIRRDLAALALNGIARKVHGGAVTLQNKYEQSLAARFGQNIPQKHEVARLATTLIPPGCTLFVDFGTTTNIFAEHVKQRADLTVFTNSHQIAATLSEDSDCEVHVLGGKYDHSVKANLGPMVVENVGGFLADFAVVGIGGIDEKAGFSDQNIEEAVVARAMIRRSAETIVLADPSKFDRHGIAHVADFGQVNYVVTSEVPSEGICRALAKSNVSLVVPPATQLE